MNVRITLLLALFFATAADASIGGGDDYDDGGSSSWSSGSSSDWGSSGSSSDGSSGSSSGWEPSTSHDWGSSPSSSGGSSGDRSHSSSSTDWFCVLPCVGVIGVPMVFFSLLNAMTPGGLRARFRGGPPQRSSSVSGSARPAGPPRPKPVPGLAKLRERDPGFSGPVLLDRLTLLHRRVTECAVSRDFRPLDAYVEHNAQETLLARHVGIDAVSHVVVGSTQLEAFEFPKGLVRCRVLFKLSRRETRGGTVSKVYREERFTLERRADAPSLSPEDATQLNCPACGNASEPSREGRCPACDSVVRDARLQWTVTAVDVVLERPVTPPSPKRKSGGVEASATRPSIVDPALPSALKRLQSRHPDFTRRDFTTRASGVFLELQRAWGAGSSEQIRPFVTDTLYQTLRFWMEPYAESGLRNRMEDVSITGTEIVKVEVDGWYESVVVRIYASALDWTEDAQGEVVGGNAELARQFSEYWTFVRTAGGSAKASGTTSCPSCAAALDRISDAGVCGYCDRKITTGAYDWVLARIEQAQAYGG